MSAPVVPLRQVERELDRQMKVLQGPGVHPVLRARMANLVVFCDSAEQVERLDRDIPDVCAVHPARVLLLVGERAAQERSLTAEVCVRPISTESRRFAYAEQVTLHAGGSGVDRLPFAVRSLLIGDLPTNLWWAAPVPPPLTGALVYELAEPAQQVLYDSLGWPDPARGVAATGGWLEQVERSNHGSRWRVASDLNWRRLKYWRRLATQALDPVSAPGAAESVTELLVEHGPHAVVQAWMLASWLSVRLGWKVQGGKTQDGKQMDWRFSGPQGTTWVRVHRLAEGPPEVRRLRIACKLEGRPGAMNLVAESPQRLAIQLEGVEAAPRTLSVPPASAAELVGRQLSDRERDPVFRESMAVAQVMAQSLLS
jgi:glucose-6-phosphate dehydrogenase assembly protein OpcA